MLLIFLTILKILGIVLLSILGLVLLLILIVLFVPIRYKAKIIKQTDDLKDVSVKADVTYLLRIFRVLINYPSEDIVKVKILFFKLYPKKQKALPQEDIKEITNEDSSNSVEEPLEVPVEESKDSVEEPLEVPVEESKDNIEEAFDRLEDASSEVIDANFDDEHEKKTILGFIHAIIDFIRKLKLTLNNLCVNIKKAFNNISFYLDVLESKEFKRAFKLLKKKLKKLFRCIRPKRIKGYIQFGADDPALVAKVFGLYSVIYPHIDKHFRLIPSFESSSFRGEVLIKGDIRIINLLIIAITVYFNKDIRYLIKLFKKEK